MRFYDAVEARTIEAEDFMVHGVHLGPRRVASVSVAPGAQVYPITLSANAAGTLVASSEVFGNTAWKSTASVIVPPTANQRPMLTNVTKSELQGFGQNSNTFGFTADLQPFSNVNTNSPTADAPPFSIQLAVANCTQLTNVWVTLS